MAKIYKIDDLNIFIPFIRRINQRVILVGGCFDILHIGHLKFLLQAKKFGGKLVVLLESDKKVKKLKGINRPFFSQNERAQLLANLKMIDYIILLDFMRNDQDYDKLILTLKPKVIVVTENDPLRYKKEIQAHKCGAKFKVLPFVNTYSSSKLAKIIGLD